MTRTVVTRNEAGQLEPVPFAHVIAMKDGQQLRATSTDHNGAYSIDRTGADQIRFTHIGHETVTLPANSIPFAVELPVKVNSLPEAIVEAPKQVIQKVKKANPAVIVAVVILVVVAVIVIVKS